MPVGPEFEGSMCLVLPNKPSHDGYVRVNVAGKKELAHRSLFLAYGGPIAAGLVIDHLCRNRACVNPWHLEPVTNKINLLRGVGFVARQAKQTHCKRHHPLSGENLYTHAGQRTCRICRREYLKQWRLAQ